MNTVKRDVILSVIKYLREECNNSELDPEQQESVDVARQCLETTYEVDDNAVVLAKDLKTVFMKAKQVSEDDAAAADVQKVRGNEYMKNDEHPEALLAYTKAILLNPTNAVYYCNRAAAYSRMEQNREAIIDCKEAIKLNPTYGKAYGRLGIAYSKLSQYQDARQAYARALELDPNNESYETNLRLADEQLRLQRSTGGMNAEGAGEPRGERGAPTGPPFDLNSFINNPALLNMASQMLNEPSFRTMVSDIIGTQTMNDSETARVDLLQFGEQLAQQLSQHNDHPEILDSFNRLRRDNRGGGVARGAADQAPSAEEPPAGQNVVEPAETPLQDSNDTKKPGDS